MPGWLWQSSRARLLGLEETIQNSNMLGLLMMSSSASRQTLTTKNFAEISYQSGIRKKGDFKSGKNFQPHNQIIHGTSAEFEREKHTWSPKLA